MGREIRRVAANWNHPTDEKGNYIPMHSSFPYNETEIQEGLRDGWLKGQSPNYGVAVMPQWPEAQRVHIQVYETVTEGTPVTPHFGTKEELAKYLSENGDFAYQKGYSAISPKPTYDQAIRFIEDGYVPSMMFSPVTGLVSTYNIIKK